jgi:hypothetical protein
MSDWASHTDFAIGSLCFETLSRTPDSLRPTTNWVLLLPRTCKSSTPDWILPRSDDQLNLIQRFN